MRDPKTSHRFTTTIELESMNYASAKDSHVKLHDAIALGFLNVPLPQGLKFRLTTAHEIVEPLP